MTEEGALVIDLRSFDIDATRGFLPATDPQFTLPKAFADIETVARLLPKWLTTGNIRKTILELPEVDRAACEALNDVESRRAMLAYSYLTHAFVWGEKDAAHVLPRVLAVPFHHIAKKMGRPPVLSYASYALDNWVRVADGPLEIGNFYLMQNFLGGIDEEWFILVHIDIEAKAARALNAIPQLIECVEKENNAGIIEALSDVHAAWVSINVSMDRMPERCDPYIYYNRVRPYIHAWKNNPALPEGLVYQGVAEYGEKPQRFRGETGAQSSIVPSMDALFGVGHEDDPLKAYLIEMQDYMPPKHRAFIAEINRSSQLRAYVKARAGETPELRVAYNDCVIQLEKFRSTHLEYAASYIHRQAPHTNNSTDVGTGGTPFMQYLKKHRDESAAHLL